jgi:photosystem II stability/assembly factor-like uncharacterized protein
MTTLDRLRRKAFVASLLVIAMLATSAERGFAHTPHDVIANVVVSPSFATDHTVFAISDDRPLRSTDGGEHWVEMVRGLTGQTLGHFAISPVDPQVVYLSSRGAGVYRSNDQGLTWESTNTGTAMSRIVELAVSRTSSDVVVAAAGLLGGLFRTVDGGETWTRVQGIGKVNAVTFVPDHVGRVVIGDASGVLHVSDDDAATFHEVGTSGDGAAITAVAVGAKKAESNLFAGTSKGDVLHSNDAGASWSKVGPGMPAHEQVNSLLLSDDYATDTTLWASTFHAGVYRSTDGGKTWTAQFKGLTSDAQAYQYGLPEFQALAAALDSSGNQLLFLAGYDGLFKSSDRGSHWDAVETLREYVVGIAVSPNYADDGTVVVNTYVKGVYISRDHGESFVESDDGLRLKRLAEGNKLLLIRRMHNVVFSPGYARDNTIFTATWTQFVKSTDGGRTWTSVIVAPPPRGSPLRQFVIAVSPRYTADQTIYLGTRQGDVYRSTKGGAAGSWTTTANLGAGVRSLVVSPQFAKDRALFASTEKGIVTSSDAGATWTATGPKGISLLAISPSYASDGTLFAGTENGLYVTRNRGETWAELTAAPLSTSSKTDAIALSPDFQHDGTVLVSVAGTGLFRSTDGGHAFMAVGSSLLDRSLIIGDFENPTSEPIQFSSAFATDRTVYAYAQQSVVRSTDGGDTWEVLDIPAASEFVARSATGPRRPKDGSDDGLPVVPIALVGGLAVAGAAFAVYRKRAMNTAG